MTDPDTLIRAELDPLAPLPPELQPDWDNVTRRVAPSAPPSRRAAGWLRKRPLLAVAAVVAVAVLPVGALAVAKSDPWWFLRAESPAAYQPVNGNVVVIKSGSWNGVDWVLTAFRSRSGALCYQLTETANGQQAAHPDGAGVCQPRLGTAVPGSKRPPLTIGFQSGTGSSSGLPRYIAGPVVGSATEVVVHLNDGTVIHTPTFPAPAALGMPIRFYATTAPTATTTRGSCAQKAGALAAIEPASLVGLDASGKVVARLTPLTPGLAKKLAVRRCNPLPQPIGPPAGTASLKPVTHLSGPYGGVATLLVGDPFALRLGKLLASGRIKHFTQQQRCFEVTVDQGGRQGYCEPVTPVRDPTWGYQTQHDGRDTFVIASQPPRTGPPIARIDLRLANGEVLTAQPSDGVAVFAIPRDALSTLKSQRGFLIAYDAQGNELLTIDHYNGRHFYRQPVYYRSCPRGSSC